MKGKGQLYIRFDSLTLPNGVSRDFRSRLSNADAPNGKVDREEGKVTGERDRSHDARTTAEGAGIGAAIGETSIRKAAVVQRRHCVVAPHRRKAHGECEQ